MDKYVRENVQVPSLELTWPLKMDGWETTFLLCNSYVECLGVSWRQPQKIQQPEREVMKSCNNLITMIQWYPPYAFRSTIVCLKRALIFSCDLPDAKKTRSIMFSLPVFNMILNLVPWGSSTSWDSHQTCALQYSAVVADKWSWFLAAFGW